MGKLIDLTGQRFGRLTVLTENGSSNSGKRKWLCQCDCGNIASVVTGDLRSGRTKSCGCLHSEVAKNKATKHGKRNSRLYRIWCSMKRRTSVEVDSGYYKYGGRGIEMCDEWKESFPSFSKWAISAGYSDSLSIDRIDNNKGYSPDNCRWVSIEVQARNKRNNINLTFQGETHILTDWAKLTGINFCTIRSRLGAGWSVERALTEPVHTEKGRKTKSKKS